MPPAYEHRPWIDWKLSIHAEARTKTKSLDLKLKATAKLPTSKIYRRFSTIFKLCPFLTKLQSEPHSSMSITTGTWSCRCKLKSLKSKFFRFLDKLHRRGSPNIIAYAPNAASASNHCLVTGHPDIPITIPNPSKRPVSAGLLLIENVAQLLGSISKKHKEGMLLHSCVILSCLASKFKNSIKRNTLDVLLITFAALVACSFLVMHLRNHYPITPKLFQAFRVNFLLGDLL